MRGAAGRVRDRWNTFWFRPEPTSTIAVVRIVFGAVATLWTLSQAPDLLAFYGPTGVLATAPPLGTGSWSVLAVSDRAPVLIALWAATLLGAVGVMVGFRTRLATILLLVGVVSFERRNPEILNAGDVLLRNLAFYLLFAPAGEALSVDRRRRARDRFWEFPLAAPWALRLMQIQLSVVYFTTLWEKLQGDLWRDGSAVSYALRVHDIHRFPTPEFVTGSVVLTELLTFGTLLLEMGLAVLVWNRGLRPWVLGGGVLLHLSIGFSIMVGFFTMLMLTTYLTFVPPETARDLVLSARRRWHGRRTRRRSRSPAGGGRR
ncbi:HTTM domain-containing protein [Actinomycetospora atypica]|uniref:HTTM domain-containing protein n=1 Tax=Actinomycetospora atypica TaxID=1290095 RepID=A0ABV9YLK6_9PSEU